MKRVLGPGAKCGCAEPACCDLCCPEELTEDTFVAVDPWADLDEAYEVKTEKKGKGKG